MEEIPSHWADVYHRATISVWDASVSDPSCHAPWSCTSRRFCAPAASSSHAWYWWIFSLFCTDQRAGPCSSTETLLLQIYSISCGSDNKDVKKCFIDVGLWNKPWASEDWIRDWKPCVCNGMWICQICNRISAPLHQGKRITGKKKCPQHLIISLPLLFHSYWGSHFLPSQHLAGPEKEKRKAG